MSRSRVLGALVLLAGVVAAVLVVAVATRPALSTPAALVQDVAESLRCPTCQNLTVADSPSLVAAGMRSTIEEQIAQGRTPDEVRDWFVDRYGPWVLLEPPRRGIWLLFWVLPALALLGGAGLAARRLRRRTGPSPELTEAEAERANALAKSYRYESLPLDERRAGAVALLAEVRSDPVSDVLTERAAQRAVLDAFDRQACPEPPTVPRQRPGSSRQRPAIRLIGGFAALALVVVATAGFLVANTSKRLAGGLPTGSVQGKAAPAPLPEDPAAAVNVLVAQAEALESQGRLLEASQRLDIALARDPQHERAQLGLASVLLKGGSTTEALGILKPLAEQRGTDPEVLLLLGLAQQDSGEAGAGETLRKFLALAPSHPAAEMVQQLVERL